MVHTILARMFEKFRKQKEEEDASGSEMVEERPDSDKEFSSVQEVSPEPTTETRSEEIPQEGRIWSFILDSPTDFTLLMPKNIVIVGMSNIPLNMELENEQSKLSLPSGPIEINYFFGVSNPIPTPTVPESDNSIFLIIGAVVIAGVIAVVFMKLVKLSPQKKISDTDQLEKIEEKPLDVETIFSSKPDLREDDKELINFISANGGKAYESELRKKFLQPRTTMWRAVKRLERYGIVEIQKKELQNLVILKKNLEDEQ